jgi:hypothetical protein
VEDLVRRESSMYINNATSIRATPHWRLRATEAKGREGMLKPAWEIREQVGWDGF